MKEAEMKYWVVMKENLQDKLDSLEPEMIDIVEEIYDLQHESIMDKYITEAEFCIRAQELLPKLANYVRYSMFYRNHIEETLDDLGAPENDCDIERIQQLVSKMREMIEDFAPPQYRTGEECIDCSLPAIKGCNKQCYACYWENLEIERDETICVMMSELLNRTVRFGNEFFSREECLEAIRNFKNDCENNK